MLYSGAKGTMTPDNRLQRTALPPPLNRNVSLRDREVGVRERAPVATSQDWGARECEPSVTRAGRRALSIPTG
jgi:hypothetical protein